MSGTVCLSSILSELASQVRATTVRMLSTTERSMLLWAPSGTSNNILWHAGHSVWVCDALTIEPITGRSELPTNWEETFGEGSQPGTHRDWPDVSEVSTRLELQLNCVLALFAEQGPSIERRASEMSINSGWQLLPGILHGWHDESRHQGEMHLLAKLYRTRAH